MSSDHSHSRSAIFHGSIVALITPFADDAVDEPCLKALVDWHIASGTHGIVPCGTTGESPTLSHDEHQRVIEIVIEQVAGRVPVIAGTGSNSTREAIEFTRHAEHSGATAALIVAPYYNKPSQEGLYQHFKAINDKVRNLPIIVYNIPGRSVVDISASTMARLAQEKNIIGVKDATGDLNRVKQHFDSCGKDFRQLSGDDDITLQYMQQGGHGCISVTANVAPDLCAAFQNACLAQDWTKAGALDQKLQPLHKALFMAPSPAPTKYAMSLLARAREEVRLPLVPLSKDEKIHLRKAMRRAGINADHRGES